MKKPGKLKVYYNDPWNNTKATDLSVNDIEMTLIELRNSMIVGGGVLVENLFIPLHRITGIEQVAEDTK